MTESTNNLPGLHPPPPEDLQTIEVNTTLYRVHKAKYDPIYFSNSGGGRFDVTAGIIYLGMDEYVAFRETIGRFSRYRLISSEELSKRRLSEIKSDRSLSLMV